jgi:hypothetical protein
MGLENEIEFVQLTGNLQCNNLLVTQSAQLPGGNGPVGGTYVVTGSENEDGFPIVFADLAPPIAPPTGYVAMVQYYSPNGFVVCDANPAAWTSTHVVVGCSQQPAVGDLVTIVLIPT